MGIELEVTPRYLRVVFAPGVHRDFGWRWLRDHGQDAASVDPVTHQRRVDTFSLDTDHPVGTANIDGDDIVISWPGPISPTRIPVPLLAGVSGVLSPADERRAWTRATAPHPRPAVEFDDLLARDDVVGGCLHSIERHGFAVITGVPDQRRATRALIDRFGPVRNSIFGDVWSVVSGSDTHADSAYGSDGLDPHTDGTYSNDPPGLQVLHFTRVAERGGASVLVDGLTAYRQLAAAHPEHVVTLSAVSVPARYVEPGVDLRAARPALRCDASGRFLQISFNNYDRAPLWLPAAQMDAFYAAYGALHDRIVDVANRVEVAIAAGEALVFDNWRLLHGRTTFEGERLYQGGYVNHEDLTSRQRTLHAAALEVGWPPDSTDR